VSKRMFIGLGVLVVLAATTWRIRILMAGAPSPPIAQANGQPQIHPFTALVLHATFLPGNSIPRETEVRTLAVRSDGSTVELFHRPDPSGSGKVLYLRKMMDAPGMRKVIIDPFSESTVTYPLTDKAVAYHTVKPMSTCDGTEAGTQLGYPVTRVEQNLGPEDVGTTLDKIVVHAWLPSRLNCIPIRRVVHDLPRWQRIATLSGLVR